MDQKTQTGRGKKYIIRVILLICLVLAGLELFYNLRHHKNIQRNTASIPSLPQNKKQDSLRTHPPDSLIWKDTEFMN
ncbi:MAG: hypothetical protein KGY60_13495 [Bacteroidales bacterium]|nr:hypothetical protein [Bacteroidales bacterium]